jgi:hypothetical protein
MNSPSLIFRMFLLRRLDRSALAERKNGNEMLKGILCRRSACKGTEKLRNEQQLENRSISVRPNSWDSFALWRVADRVLFLYPGRRNEQGRIQRRAGIITSTSFRLISILLLSHIAEGSDERERDRSDK